MHLCVQVCADIFCFISPRFCDQSSTRLACRFATGKTITVSPVYLLPPLWDTSLPGAPTAISHPMLLKLLVYLKRSSCSFWFVHFTFLKLSLLGSSIICSLCWSFFIFELASPTARKVSFLSCVRRFFTIAHILLLDKVQICPHLITAVTCGVRPRLPRFPFLIAEIVFICAPNANQVTCKSNGPDRSGQYLVFLLVRRY